ncbi:Fe(3+) dicitrate transport protein FecA [Methylobacterium crusticola]|uniref:Fe(3+) dicitrate transport protein FecA n=1 Tax=Methylobacterium crusticola TaxID=1697972 RepID=A0ABQ4R4B8_9HYPH|nr:TonB-dependent siderophore receptor [Methylobacterium crusticola]GJD52277.1 Fe(3+) dicitrate transport protein FecA [Methylobacterium crusticola]
MARSLCITGLAAFLGLTVEAGAAPDDAIALEAIDVSASPLATAQAPLAARAYAGSLGEADQAAIQASGARNITEALRLIPGVQAPPPNGTGSGDFAQNIGIRGLTARFSGYATVLLDGIPLSSAPYLQPELSLAPVSFGMLERIDVIKSGAAVRYGPQNVGGVINYVTWPIPKEFGGLVRLRGNLNGSEQARGFLNGQADLVVGATNPEGSGLALLYSGNHGPSFRPRTNQDIDDAMLKYRVQLTPESYVDGRVHGYNATADLPGPLDRAGYARDPYGSTNGFQTYQGSRIEGVTRYVNEFDGTKYFETTLFDTSSRRTFGLSNRSRDAAATVYDVTPRSYNTFGIEPRFSVRTDLLGLNQEISLGYRYVREDAEERRLRRSFRAGANPFLVRPALNRDSSGATDAHAAYLDDKFTFGTLTITPGIRVEDVTTSRRNNQTGFRAEEHYTVPLPSLRVGFQATPALFLYGNVGRSFGAVGFLQLPASAIDQHIDPEIATTAEVGARYTIGGLAADVAVFQFNFDNQIVFDTLQGVYTNVGRTLHRGVETSLRYDLAALDPALAGLSAYATYAYIDATVDAGPIKGNDLRLYSRHSGTVGVSYATGPWQLDWFGYAQSGQFADEANTAAPSADGKLGRIPGWTIWNARLTCEVAPLTTLTVGVQNVLDKRYYTRASLDDNGGIYAGPPRTAYVELRTRF